MNIVFTGSKSNSGYGLATQSFKESFNLINKFDIHYNISNDIINYDKNIKYDIEFVLNIPPFSHNHIAKYRIGYFYWETDRLPDSWVNGINNCDEIWAPCNLVKNVCLKAGYNKPIYIIPTPTVTNTVVSNIRLKNNYSGSYLNPDYYKFYSVFQWQPRKGYKELLSAYFDEFKYGEEVVLILKINFIPGVKEKDIIKEINKIKNYYNSKAKVFLITEYLSNNDIYLLNNFGDCFVLPHYGEGWGMPIHEAAVFGNPIITTKYGGITEFLNDNVFWIDHNMVPVSGMEWNSVYSADQNWAQPDIESLKNNLRFVFNNKIKKSKKFLDFSTLQISKKLESRLNEIKA